MNNIENININDRYKLVYDYTKLFWRELLNKCFCELIKFDKIPLCISENYLSYDSVNNTATCGRVDTITDKRYIVVEISIHPDLTIEEIKSIIRHELIHFGLTISELKSNDNTATFTILCELFNAPTKKDLDIYEKKIYLKYLEPLKKLFSQINDINDSMKFSVIIAALADIKGCNDSLVDDLLSQYLSD